MDWSIGNLIWIVLGGALIGVLAVLIVPGKQNLRWWAVVIAGIVGMLVGDWLAGLLGVQETAGFDWIRHALQIVVAVVAVGGTAAVFGRRSSV
ncbi:MAG: hypothetical protein R2737_16405 [Candidatus Nanopelagicales bacterium]